MTLRGHMASRRWGIAALVAAILAAVALAMIGLAGRPQESDISVDYGAAPPAGAVVPQVEPLLLDATKPDEARKLNAAIPFTTEPVPAARAFKFPGDATALERATDCLAAAMIYEAGDDPKGERAVGQVVLNRLRHPAFPKTVCGVVFQGQERATGCQFTFTCDGAMARIPSAAGWQRARGLASAMLAGEVYKPVGYATHYHTDWVMPYWSASLDKVTAVDTHLFFRWQGWWGTPPAFARSLAIAQEPAIDKLALLSPAHKAPLSQEMLVADARLKSLVDDTLPAIAIGPEQIGKRIGPGRLAAIESGGNGFVMTLDKGGDPARYAEAAARICAGRAQCRLLAWTSAGATPRAFPIAEDRLASMSFSYIRLKETGLERMLFNCEEFPAAPRIQCMAKRIPTAAAPRLLADEKADKAGRVRLPDLPADARPVADLRRGELVPVKRVEVLKLQKPAATTGTTPGTP